MDSRLWNLATHEAGHILVALEYDRLILEASIDSDWTEGENGKVLYMDDGNSPDEEDAIYMAGYATNMYYDASKKKEFWKIAAFDRSQVVGSVSKATKKATAIIVKDIDTLEDIAYAILDSPRGRLSGRQIDKVVGIGRPATQKLLRWAYMMEWRRKES